MIRPRLAGAAALAVLLLVASLLAGCSDKKTAQPASSTSHEVAPVQVSGQALPEFTSAERDPAVGQKAPVLSGRDLAGKPLRIAPDGRPKLILFVAHWCPHCRREVPLLAKWINSGKAPKNVEIVTVATGTRSDYPNYPPSKWLRDAKWTPPVLADSSDYAAATAFGLSEYPYFVLLRADGTVAARTSGEISVDDLGKALRNLASDSASTS